MSWDGQVGGADSWGRAGKKILLWELIDLNISMEPPGENIQVLEGEILVGNIDMESHQHVGDHLKSWELMKK